MKLTVVPIFHKLNNYKIKMRKLVFMILFTFFMISCDKKPDTSKFDNQMKDLKVQIGTLEQDLINCDNQTKRAIGLAEHFDKLYFSEREKVDSLKNVIKKLKNKK